MSENQPSAAPRHDWRSWLTVAVVIALPPAALAMWVVDKLVLHAEPYPALRMPEFRNAGGPDGTGPHHEPIVEIVYADGTVEELTEREFLDPMPPSHYTVAMRALFPPYEEDWTVEPMSQLDVAQSRWLYEWAEPFSDGREIVGIRCVWYDIVAVRGGATTRSPLKVVHAAPAENR